MSLLVIALVVGGLVALVLGGEVLVRGASGMAAALGMSPLLVGLTVVAFATSAPEMAVTVDAALEGSPGIGLGNVVGSNIINVLLVLGATALLAPIAVGRQLLRSDLPVLVGVSVLTLLLALDGSFTRLDGVVLVACAVGSILLSVRIARRDRSASDAAVAAAGGEDEAPRGRGRLLRDLALVAAGVVLLVLGARWLVGGATEIALALGVDDLVVGLTVVAIGTSLPELVTSVVATVRGELELALGNIAGSCLLNLGAVLGVAALLAPDGVPVPRSALTVDLPFMVAVAVVLLVVALTGAVVSRPEGAGLLVCYVTYTVYLVLDASGSALATPLAAVLLLVVPLVAVAVLPPLAGRAGRRTAQDA